MENNFCPRDQRLRPEFSTVAIPAIFAGLMGCLLLALGIPHFIAAFQSLDARSVVWNIYADAPVASTDMVRADAGLARANAWVRDGERDGDRNLILMHEAIQALAATEQAKLWDAAEAAAVSALSLAPAQPSVWFRLADLRVRKGDRKGAITALRLSMLSGSFVPVLMIPRIELGLKLLSQMDAESLALLKRQIRLTWVTNSDFVMKLALRADGAPLMREALAELSESEMTQFQHRHESKP